MNHPPHLLFAPGRPWKRKSPAYRATHRNLRFELEEEAISRVLTEKRRAHLQNNQQYRQTGELHG